jgi:imidazolonepropionase
LIKGGKILEVGKKGSLTNTGTVEVKLDGGIVTPGLIDPHTHAFPPQDRSHEFSMRVNKSYMEIAEEGGGIISSMKAVRSSSLEDIIKANEKNVQRFIM